MALRRLFGFSDGELMRSDAKPCSRLMRQTAGICTVGGGLGFWILCRLHYGNASSCIWTSDTLSGYLTSCDQISQCEEEIYCLTNATITGPRITVPRSLRWAACGAVSVSSTSALLVRLFSPECEPQNIAAYDKGK